MNPGSWAPELLPLATAPTAFGSLVCGEVGTCVGGEIWAEAWIPGFCTLPEGRQAGLADTASPFLLPHHCVGL